MFVFRVILPILLLLIQFHLYRRITDSGIRQLKSLPRRIGIAAMFVAFSLPVVILVFWRPRLAEWPTWSIIGAVYPFYIWHFISVLTIVGMGCIKLITLMIAAGTWFVEKVQSKSNRGPMPAEVPDYDPRRRAFFRHGFTLLAATTVAGTAYSAFRRGEYELTEISVPIKNLPPAFHGFTIALLSDIHSSPFMTKSQMDEYVRGVNSLNADLIAIPGDLVNSEIEEAYPFAEAFSDLRARYGVFGTLGNHDFFTRNPDLVTDIISDCGINILRNDRIYIEKEGDRLLLVGIDDTGSGTRAGRFMDAVLAGASGADPRILLCHRPYFFGEAQRRGFGLTLSGHTHGGQVVLARFGQSVVAPARFASRYVAGLYSQGDSRMYVSRGIGTVGVPFRINCPPEITRISLRQG
jgi:predicted MPP superfamily phosphohydrolase